MKPTIHTLHTESIYSRGGEKYLYELLRRAARTHNIHLYLHAVSPKWVKKYNEAHITVHTLWKPPRFYWFLLPVTVALNYLQLRSRVRPRDVIVATNFPMNFLAVSLSKRTICHCAEPLPIFYDAVRVASLPPFSRFCVWVAKGLYAPLDNFSYRRCAILTTLNRSVEQHVFATYKRKPDVFLPNGVDDKQFSPGSRQTTRNYFLIGHSTDYTVFKGTQDFLAILRQLHKTGIAFRVKISEGIADRKIKRVYENYVRRYGIADRIKFVGTLSERQLIDFYRDLDVFVFTGSPAGSGAAAASLSVLEAQACGIPVVRSVGDDQEIVQGKTGFYIHPYDHASSAKTLEHFFRLSPQTRKRMKHAARDYVSSRFNWGATARTFRSLVKSLP